SRRTRCDLGDAQLTFLHPHALQVLEGFLRHAFGQIDVRELVEDLDAADVATFDAGLVGDGTDDVGRFHFMGMTDFDAEAFHAGFHRARVARITTEFTARGAWSVEGFAVVRTAPFLARILTFAARFVAALET